MFTDENLKIADLIQRRRLQLVIHSCIYYEMNTNLVTDKQWDSWAKELVQLQHDYPEISSKVCWYKEFKDWDGSSGAFLPIKDKWVVYQANKLLHNLDRTPVKVVEPEKPQPIKSNKQQTLF